MNKVALITGVTGQDGAYLAELLLSKGYTVHGVKRRSSSFNTGRIEHFYHDRHEAEVRFFLHYGDLTDATNLIRLVQEVQPTEIYNLAAQSHPRIVSSRWRKAEMIRTPLPADIGSAMASSPPSMGRMNTYSIIFSIL